MPRSQSYTVDERRIGLLARDLLDRLGDRWSALVIYGLHEGTMRFSELKERIDEIGPKRLSRTEISHKMLAESLRALRRDGLVVRSLIDGTPHYALTRLGRSFWEPMMAVHGWAAEHLDDIEAARRVFDQLGAASEDDEAAGEVDELGDCARPLDCIVKARRRIGMGMSGVRKHAV